MAASGIGASDIVSATVGGATYGLALLWALALGAFFKFVLSEGLARWQLATGSTALEGWARQLPRWVMVLFAGYLVLWAVAVSGALVSGCGLAIENITGGAVPRTWGGFAQAVAAFALIWSAHATGLHASDEAADRRDVREHRALRRAHLPRTRGRAARAVRAGDSRAAAALTCFRSSAESAARSRC